MKSHKLEEKELARQRQMLSDSLRRALYELEGQPVPRRRNNGFPFNLLEKAINWALLSLERSVAKLVAAVFSRLDSRRR